MSVIFGIFDMLLPRPLAVLKTPGPQESLLVRLRRFCVLELRFWVAFRYAGKFVVGIVLTYF